jgi:cytochrome c oxidase cbb3-type subunit 3
MSGFWNAWVWILTLGTLVGCLWLLQQFTRAPKSGKHETTGHSWDGDLREYNNPLPRWWLTLFWITGVFMAAYLLVFPGLGNFAGLGGWTQKGQYEAEMAAAEQRFGNVYAAFAARPAGDLVHDAAAVRLGRNLFLNRCATCHGSDGGGAKGFPNLTDAAWLWGGSPEAIAQTISGGRTGVMPALGAALGPAGVDEVIAYLRSIGPAAAAAGDGDRAALAAAGRQKFVTFCSACHGPEARGNPALGAPNLTDADWLHGAGDADIRDVIDKGRVNQMPAQQDVLTPERIHVLSAYVLSLAASGDGG